MNVTFFRFFKSVMYKGSCSDTYYESSLRETYFKILELKGYNPTKLPNGKSKPLGELVLRNDLKKRKIIWNNNFLIDFLFYSFLIIFQFFVF